MSATDGVPAAMKMQDPFRFPDPPPVVAEKKAIVWDLEDRATELEALAVRITRATNSWKLSAPVALAAASLRTVSAILKRT